MNIGNFKIIKQGNPIILDKKYGPVIDKSDKCSLINLKTKIQLRPKMFFRCTNKKCDKIEKRENEFRKCAMCKTVYCSKECSLDDWNNGDHKNFCIYERYDIQKDLYFRKLYKKGEYTDTDVVFGNEYFDKKWEKKGQKYFRKVPENYKKIYVKYY